MATDHIITWREMVLDCVGKAAQPRSANAAPTSSAICAEAQGVAHATPAAMNTMGFTPNWRGGAFRSLFPECGVRGFLFLEFLFLERVGSARERGPSRYSTRRVSAALPIPSPLARHWSLDPGVVYLNHGSFGATPTAVLAAQQGYRDRMEREAVRFFVEYLPGAMDRARAALARFLNADAGSIAPITNATIAIATVLDNLVRRGRLNEGDELLTNAHEYPACQNNLRRAARDARCAVVSAEIPFPCPGPDAVVDSVLAKVTSRTRVVLLSHVTSPTGLVLPVGALVPELHRRGVITIIDGAHAAGMIDGLDLGALAPCFYTSNCHKWICSPKGSAFLHVREDFRDDFRPLVLSNNAESPQPGRDLFRTEFDYQGTADLTALLAIPDALEFMPTLLPGGWPEIIRHNHDLCLRARNVLCQRWGVAPTAPDFMVGSICTLVLPKTAKPMLPGDDPASAFPPLQQRLMKRHSIQVPVWSVPGRAERTLRISAQLYNSIEQYGYLAEAVAEELAREGR